MQARDRLSWLELDHVILPPISATTADFLDIPVTGFEWWALLTLRWTVFNNVGAAAAPMIQFLNGGQILANMNSLQTIANLANVSCNFNLLHALPGLTAPGLQVGCGLYIGVGDQSIRLTTAQTDPGNIYAVVGGTMIGRLWARRPGL